MKTPMVYLVFRSTAQSHVKKHYFSHDCVTFWYFCVTKAVSKHQYLVHTEFEVSLRASAHVILNTAVDQYVVFFTYCGKMMVKSKKFD